MKLKQGLRETTSEFIQDPLKVEAYRCQACNGIVLGTLEQTRQHRRFSFGQPLPRGFVYLINPNKPYSKIYHLIMGKGTKRDNTGKVISNSLNESFHCYLHESAVLTECFNQLQCQIIFSGDLYIGESRRTQRLIERDICRLLTPNEQKEFINLYKT